VTWAICDQAGDATTEVTFCVDANGNCTPPPDSNPDSTPSPTVDECILLVNQYDMLGDGWNGDSFSLYLWNGGPAVQTITMNDGSYDETCLTMAETNACYYFQRSTVGSSPNEVSLSLCGEFGTVDMYISFCLDSEGNCVLAEPCSSSVYVNLYDSYGDGWNGNVYGIYLQGNPYDVVQTVTLDEGSVGDVCLDVEPNSCYTFSLYESGSWTHEISWDICGESGSYGDEVSFCVDSDGVCYIPPSFECDLMHDGYCYWVADSYLSFNDAVQACLAEDSTLASVWDEMTIQQLVSVVDESVWIGFSDASTEGSWEWQDGSVVTYTNWAWGEPNNWSEEDCAQMYTSGQWNDLDCNDELPFVCKKPVGDCGSSIFVDQFDSFGDGWNNFVFGLFVEGSTTALQEITLESGSYGSTCLNVQPSVCYLFEVLYTGTWANEISWTLCGASGDYSTALSFCVDAEGNCVPPNPDPTPSPTFDECILVVSQYDTWGDGWDGFIFNLQAVDDDSFDGQLITMDDGHYDEVCLNVAQETCYIFGVSTEGLFESEISWSICNQTGNASSKLFFCVDAIGQCSDAGFGVPVSDGNDSFNCSTALTMFDSFGDGWNGFGFSIYSSEGVAVDTISLDFGHSGQACLDLQENACYWFGVSEYGSWESEISWTLCGVEGTFDTHLSFCLDRNSVCSVPESSCMTLSLFDSSGSGWEGNYFSLYSTEIPNSALQTVTLANGYSGSACLNVQEEECYSFGLSTDGFGQSEISWELCGITGAVDTTLAFCVDGSGSCVVSDEECPEAVFLYDSYGDGWNGYSFGVFMVDDLSAVLQSVTMNHGFSSSVCLDVEVDSCYFFALDNVGSWPLEISWFLCGETGMVDDYLYFCIDSEGTCSTLEDTSTPTLSATPAPTDPCTYVTQYDDWGDGWQGYEFSVYSADDSSIVIDTITLEDGSIGYTCLHLEQEGCYTFDVSAEGGYGNEISWALCGETGGVGDSLSFCIDDAWNCVPMQVNCSATMYLFDTYGDGWNYAEIAIVSVDDDSTILETAELLYGNYSTMCLDSLDADACYTTYPLDDGIHPSDVYYMICGEVGSTSTNVIFCLDLNGRCDFERRALEGSDSAVNATADCGDNEIVIAQSDDGGDGWNGFSFDLTTFNDTEQIFIQTVEMLSGTYQESCLDVELNACYNFKPSTQGSWSTEVSWMICNTTGYFNTEMDFCINSEGECTNITITESECTINIEMWDVSGSGTGWDSATYAVFDDKFELIMNGTEWDDYSKCMNLDAGTYGIFVNSGMEPQYQAWSISSCNIATKGACDIAWFEIDDSGVCIEVMDRECTDPEMGDAEIDFLEGCDPVASSYYEYSSWGTFGVHDTFTLNVEDTGVCDEIILTVHMDWTDYGSFQSDAYFTIVNMDSGDTTDSLNQEMSVENGILSTNEYSKVFVYCIEPGNYQMHIDDIYSDGWSNGYVHVSYTSPTQNGEIGSYTLTSDDYAGLDIDFAVGVDVYNFYVTLDWPEDGDSYPSEASFEILTSEGEQVTDYDGTTIVGEGAPGSQTFSFELIGTDALYLYLYDVYGDGWDYGTYSLSYSFNNLTEKFFLTSGTLEEGYSMMVPIFVNSKYSSIAKDVVFERAGVNESWNITEISSSQEWHGCACGTCDGVDGFDMIQAEELAMEYLELRSNSRDEPVYCNILSDDLIVVSHSFSDYRAPVIVTYTLEDGEWSINDVEEGTHGAQCYSEKDYTDCKREKGEFVCMLQGMDDNELDTYGTCAEDDFTMCSDPFQSAYEAFSGVISGGMLTAEDQACSLIVAPYVPGPLVDKTYIEVELTVVPSPGSEVLITVYSGYTAADEIIFNNSFYGRIETEETAGETQQKDMDLSFLIPGSEFRINTLLSRSQQLHNYTGSFSSFIGSYTAVFNVSSNDMELVNVTDGSCEFNFCLDTVNDEGFLVFDKQAWWEAPPTMSPTVEVTEAYSYVFDVSEVIEIIDDEGTDNEIYDTDLVYLIDLESAPDSVWLNFLTFELMEGEYLRIHDGKNVTSDLLVKLDYDWFTVDTGTSAQFVDSSGYAVFETVDYPVCMMMWLKTEGEAVIIGDDRFSLSLESRIEGTEVLVPMVTWNGETTWYGNTNITTGDWTHVAVTLYTSQGLVEFTIDGDRVETCSGDPSMNGYGDCPKAKMIDDFDSATSNGYLILGCQDCGPFVSSAALETSADFQIDELRFYKEKLDASQIQGAYSNGSIDCDFGDQRLFGCYHMDDTFDGSSGEIIEDGSMSRNSGLGFGINTQDGVSGLSSMTSTTFAASGSSLLLVLNRTLPCSNTTGEITCSSYTSNFIATYEARSCPNCVNGYCERGVCVCDAGYGGETCEDYLVDEACTGGIGAVHGAEYKSEYGTLNFTLVHAHYNRWLAPIFPKFKQNMEIPQVDCEWLVSKDYAIAKMEWVEMQECFNGNMNFTVYDGIEHVGEESHVALVSATSFDDLDYSIKGTTGELQTTFSSSVGATWDCVSAIEDYNGISMEFSVSKVYYVAPNSDFLSSVKTRSGADDAPFTSISDALAAASANAIIMLYPGRYEGFENINLEITFPVSIIGVAGAEYTILDADGKDSHFTIMTRGEVTLEGISFINGYTTSTGSSVIVQLGNLNIIDCSFMDNYAQVSAALYVEAPGFLTVTGTTFDSNAAGHSASALLVDSAQVTVADCLFVSNQAGVYGTVVVTRGSYFSSVSISSSTFNKNKARYYTIAVLNGQHLSVSDSTFKNNIVTEHTSGIYSDDGSTVDLLQISFEGNVGTAVSLTNPKDFTLSDFEISGTQLLEGEIACVYASGADGFEISNGVFERNDGHAVFIEGSTGVLISSTLFSMHGTSSIYLDQTAAEITQGSFHNNTAVQGGAIHVSSCEDGVTISQSSFDGNSATMYGGAIYNSASGLTISDSSFLNNKAEYGGSIYVTDTDDLSQVISGTSFEMDSATSSGGSLYMFAALNVEVSSTQFFNCTASEDGGGWYLDESDATVDSLHMEGCTSSSNGGGITGISGSNLYLHNAMFTYCSSETGGAVAIKSQSLFYMDVGLFDHNSAEDGGALSVQEESDVSISGGVLFSHNTATMDGGAIYLVRLNPTRPFINGATFSDNSADFLGGSVYLALCDSMHVINMSAINSDAEAGADISSLASELTISSSYLSYGTTAQGGLYLLHSDFKMFSSHLGESSADENGGLIYAFASNLDIGHCNFHNGSAGAEGGGIFLFDSPSTYYDTNFSANAAVETGGALYVTGTESVEVRDCFFTDNYAERGAGMHFQESTFLSVTNSYFLSNKAEYEGAGMVCEDNDFVNITNTVFDHNTIVGTSTSSIYGGGGLKLYVIDEAYIIGDTFTNNGGEDQGKGLNNTYIHDGGAMYVAYSGCYIADCYFANNTAEDGGAIYFGPESVSSDRRLSRNNNHMHSPGFSRLGLRSRLFTGRSGERNHPAQKISHKKKRELSTGSSVVISGSSFEANTATSGGGAMSYEENEPTGFANNTFTANTAAYGSAFTSPPSLIVPIYDENSIEKSGYTISVIRIELRDIYDQVVHGYDGVVYVESLDDEATVSMQTDTDFHNGVARFNGLVVEKEPGSTAQISFSTSLVSNTANVTLTFRECLKGEILPEGTGTCSVCPYGQFSLVPAESYCHECPVGAVCYGGSHIKAKRGYWRFTNSTGVCSTDPAYDNCELHECYEIENCNGDIEIYDAVTMDPDGKTLILGINSNPWIMDNWCWNPKTNYSECVLDLSGYKVTLASDETAIIRTSTTPFLTLSKESSELVQHLKDDREASYILHLLNKEECGPEYTGNLCARCNYGYGRSSGYLCTKCNDDLTISYLIMISTVLLVAVFGAIMIKLQMNKENSENEKISIMMKIFTSYMQLLSLFSALDMEWPDAIQEMFDKQEMVSKVGDRLIQIDCIFNTEDSVNDAASLFYKKLMFFMALPPLVIVFTALFWSSMYLYKKEKFRRNPWNFNCGELEDIAEDGMIDADEVKETLAYFKEPADDMRVEKIIESLHLHTHPARVEHFQEAYLHAYGSILSENWILSVVVLLFMLHPNVAQYTFYVFTCVKLDTTRSFLQEDLDTICNDRTHNLWKFACGVPFMALYTFGIPGFAFYVLHKHKDDLKNKHTRLKYGFLYDGYEQPYYFWELWVMMRKILVIAVTVFVAGFGATTEALGGLIIANFALIAHLRCQPYEDDSLDQLESYSLYTTVITLIGGLFFYSGEVDTVSGVVFLITVVLLVNCAFILIFATLAYMEYRKKVLAVTTKTHEKIMTMRKDMKENKLKTHSQIEMTQRKRKKVEKLEQMYESRMELQHEQMMNKLQIEEAKKKIHETKAVSEQLSHELEKIDRNLRAELNKGLGAELKSSKAEKRGSVVWDHHDDFLSQVDKSTLDEIPDAHAEKNEYGEAIFSLYEQSVGAQAAANEDEQGGGQAGESKEHSPNVSRAKQHLQAFNQRMAQFKPKKPIVKDF